MEFTDLILTLLLIILIAFSGYKILLGVRFSRKFNREWNEAQNSEKTAYLKQKKKLSSWELGSFTKLPKPLALFGSLLALAFLLLVTTLIIAALIS